MSTLLVKRLSKDAILPQRSSTKAAGYDLSSAKNMIIPAKGKARIPTDLSFEFPEGVYGRIADRSGMAYKNHIAVAAGVIDADYTGPVGIVLFNHSDKDFKISTGDRVAQLILEMHKIVPVEEVESLTKTDRGDSGFGSSGISSSDKRKMSPQ
jgi:dUTP pyrophosphatase